MALLRGKGLRAYHPILASIYDWLTRTRARRLRVARSGGLEFTCDPDDQGLGERLLAGVPYEPQETGVVSRLLSPGSTFVDIGANLGYFTTLASRAVGTKGSVHAFEPESHNLSLLRGNLARNGCHNVQVHPCAASDHEGVASFYLDCVNHGGHRLYPRAGSSRPIRIKTRRVDDVLGPDVFPDLIKLDVEGAELQALEGMKETLARVRDSVVLLFELAPESLSAAGTDSSTLLARIDELGLGLHDLAGHPVSGECAVADTEATGFTNLLATARTDLAERIAGGAVCQGA